MEEVLVTSHRDDVSFTDVTAFKCHKEGNKPDISFTLFLIHCASFRSEKVSQKLKLSIRG